MPSSLTRKPPPSPPSPRSLLPPDPPQQPPTTVFIIGYSTSHKKQTQFFNPLHQTASTWVGHVGPDHTPVTVKLVPLMDPALVSYNQLLHLHAIIHKRTDDIAAYFTTADPHATRRLECLHAFLNTNTIPIPPNLPLPDLPHHTHQFPISHPYPIVSVDPLEGVWRLIDRTTISKALDSIFSPDRNLPPCLRPVTTVAWTPLPVAHGPRAVCQALTHHLHFPVILKSRLACGTQASHEMAIAYDTDGALAALKTVFNLPSLSLDHSPDHMPPHLQSTDPLLDHHDIATGVVAQQFIPNHGGVLFKVYAVGDNVSVQPRASVHVDVESSPGAYYCFDSQRLSRTVDYNFDPITGLSEGTEAVMPSKEIVTAVVSELSKELGLSLIGVDMVYDVQSGMYFVVDVNYFPGYNGVHQAHEWVLQHTCELIWKRLHK